MKIASIRTRQDMEMAAELRASGATWKTVAENLRRRLNVVWRWTRWYRDEWEALLRDAEERASREGASASHAVMRQLLRHKNAKIRLSTAEKLIKLRLAEKAAEPPRHSTSNLSALLTHLEELSDVELDHTLDRCVGDTKGAAVAIALH